MFGFPYIVLTPAGSAEFIARARRVRKMLGGGMRQAGVIAAAALYALDNNFDRLEEDHENAHLIAEALAEVPFLTLNPAEVETNIVIFTVEPPADPDQLQARLRQRGVLVSKIGPRKLRAVTHLDVSLKDAEKAADVIRDTCGALAQ